jgi:hypothetical protein
MATHDYIISNSNGSGIRSDLNAVLQAIASNNSSATEPTPAYAYQFWADTSSGYMKQRNAANTAWLTRWPITTDSPSYTGAFKNIIINGDMVVAQTGTAISNIVSANILDRWKIGQTTSSILSYLQSDDVPASKGVGKSLLLTVTTADSSIAPTDYSLLYQYIEGYDVRQLAGKTFTLSFWVKSNITGTFGVNFCNAGVDRSFVSPVTINAANTWEFKTITVVGGLNYSVSPSSWNQTTGVGLGLRISLAAGSNFHASTTNSFISGNFLSTAAQTNFVGTIGNTFAITDVQLELGTVATNYEYLPIEAGLKRCQRYREKSYPMEVVPGTVTSDGTVDFGLTQTTTSNSHAVRHTIQYKANKGGTGLSIYLYSPDTGNGGTGASYRVRHVPTGNEFAPTIINLGYSSATIEAQQGITSGDFRYRTQWMVESNI